MPKRPVTPPRDEPPVAPLQPDVPAIVSKLLEKAEASTTFRALGAYPLPNVEDVQKIVSLLREVLFFGYMGRQDLTPEELADHLESLTRRAFDMLSEQIARSFRHNCERVGGACDKCIGRGRREATLLLNKLPTIREMLEEDVRAAYDGDPAAKSYDEVIFSYPGLYAITVHRVAHELYAQSVPLLPRLFSELAHSATGIDIHPGARIGRAFFIDHGTGVVIGETTIIGDHVKMYQSSTLGAFSFPRDACGALIRDAKRHPTIEDHVTIYAGATILGGDTVIGKGSSVGGSVWLTRSVPPGTKVVIEPPRLQYKDSGLAPKGEQPQDFQI